MTDPNVNATAESVSDKIDGIDGDGNQLSYRKVAMFYDSHLFGRAVDYAFPEGANVSSSMCDHAASEAKLWTRTRKMSDGNDYDAHDALYTLLKIALQANPHINDDEPLSVNYKAPAT
ncbi:hypothetical protein DQP57_00430 [Mycobacterium colombiense]|uniref:Uncharacterized protein n=1 Tax=Mycobacterium colombiense TaxID=339268 RepID=A0A329MBS1_9MYCO|nr:hypothetical protein [Mycobacterium colombiense]RAV17525.1 hypothetical protein DQP57_00430 [Mycobacterium colombiense]